VNKTLKNQQEKKIEAAVQALIIGNQTFLNTKKEGYSHQAIETISIQNGQNPYAVVITCSDSRVPPEHIFSAGIGDIFVIRTAGNVIGEFELGSIEYAVEHLGTPVILVLGHNHCGAVAAAMEGHGGGNVQKILDEIIPAISGEKDVDKCEKLNIEHSFCRITESEIVSDLIDKGQVKLISGKYDLETGVVEFFQQTCCTEE